MTAKESVVISFLFTVMLVFWLAYIIVSDGIRTRALIKEQAAKVEYHYLLPDDSACAVKMMYFRHDATTDLIPAVRTVCHFDHSK